MRTIYLDPTQPRRVRRPVSSDQLCHFPQCINKAAMARSRYGITRNLCGKHHQHRVTYRLSEDEYLTLMETTHCEICGTHLGLAPKIDHNHKTGEVRGLLCNGCNTGIGMLKDDPQVLRSALRYLEQRGFQGCVDAP